MKIVGGAMCCPRCEGKVPGDEATGLFNEDHSYFCKKCKILFKFSLVSKVNKDLGVARLEEIH